MPPSVSIGLVTWNSEAHVERAIEQVRRQTWAGVELLVVDNASTDRTRALLEPITVVGERLYADRNLGYSAAHNLAIGRTRGEYYLALNPDVFLEPHFIERLVEAVASRPAVGAAAGKLLRADDPLLIDSAGIAMFPSQRHLDRGQGRPDGPPYDAPAMVFGVTGAAGFYRRAMLEDIAIDDEVFDEDFFAYREDADLAWRAQLLGWQCIYVPAAVALHIRRVTPERRSSLPPEINRMSVRNRFLLRLKNQTAGHALRFLVPALWRDLQVVCYCLLRERGSLGAYADVLRLLPRMLAKRRSIMSRRRATNRQIVSWFRTQSMPVS
ncbi:MAG: glycosyltransferase family 2 protein [Vicinamibacterales bacterium]